MVRPAETLPAVWPTLVVVLALCASEFASGAYFGFLHSFGHVLVWVFSVVLALTAFIVADRVFAPGGFDDVAVRAGVIAFGLVVLCGLLFGATGLLSRRAYLVAESLLLVWALGVVPRGFEPREATVRHVPLVTLGLWTAIIAFVVGMGIGHSPFTAYDSLSYHLYFPARWLQAHQLSIVATPFSDEAQAYQPANGELWFLWLMLPLHGDFLARVGQVPFYLLAAAASYALARRSGAAPVHALYAPTFVLIARPIVEQAVGANVDLISAATFAASVYLGIVAVDSDSRRDWALWGVSVGLFLGTKYLAIVYLPVLLALPIVRRFGRAALWALPGVVVFGLPWYVRNWIVAGSPIFPATLRVAGITFGTGAYTHAAMAQSFLHTSDPRLLIVSLAHAFGVTTWLVLLPAAALVIIAIVSRKAWWPAGFVAAATVTGPLLVWLSVGDNTDPRFLLPAVMTGLSLLPLGFRAAPSRTTIVHGFYALGIAWILVGRDTQLPVSLPWFMADWLSLQGVVDRQFLIPFALLAIATTGACRIAPRRWRAATACVVAAVAGVTLAIGGEQWCVPSRCSFVQVSSPHLRLNFLYGSRWLGANVTGANVAYTGINLPYPLSGSRLQNVVYYVNIDRHGDWRFHDYVRSFQRAPARATIPAALAAASGLLMPAQPHGGTVDALRPRFERMIGDRDAWFENLRTRDITYLFVSTLDPYEIEYVWHNAQGFPIEDEWARSAPTSFHSVYENPDVHIYRATIP